MNDNEIMKSLDACDNCFCENCSYKSKTIYCREELIKDALSLINRQKSEIESLEETRYELACTLDEFRANIGTIKAEAIKEFAERLKEKTDNPGKAMFDVYEYYGETIDNLEKEMTEEEK